MSIANDTNRRDLPRPPIPLVLLGCVGLLFFLLPVIGLVGEVAWRDLPQLLSSPVVVDAIRLSLVSSVAATLLAAVAGVPLAWLLVRVDFPGKSLVRGLVLLPLVLPPVVGGAALLFALGPPTTPQTT